MARISTYPIDSNVNINDYIIGTDSDNNSITKNYTISSIIALAESSIDLSEVLAVGNTATNNIVLTGMMTATNLTATAGITNNLLYIDSLGFSGTVNQVLLSTGTATQWGNQVISTWDLNADSGGPLTISNEDGVDINGGTYITTLLSVPATDKVISITHDDTARSDTPFTPSALAHGGTFTAITATTTNATGHVTGVDTATYTLPSASNSGGYFGSRVPFATTPTAIVILDTYYVLNYTWANMISSLWSDRTNAGGYNSGFEYTGAPTAIFNIICNFRLTAFTAGSNVTFALYKNGSIVTGSDIIATTLSNGDTIGIVQAMLSLSTNDYIELWVKSDTLPIGGSTTVRAISVSAVAV